jgi:peroxiredoxin
VKRVEKDYAKENLKVIWIGFQDKEENLKRFMLKHNIKEGVGFDADNKVAYSYGIRYGAGLVIINSEGIVKERVPKGFSEKTLYESVDAVLRSKGDNQKT